MDDVMIANGPDRLRLFEIASEQGGYFTADKPVDAGTALRRSPTTLRAAGRGLAARGRRVAALIKGVLRRVTA